MIKGIFTSGMGMKPRMLKLDILANNIANANTTGFKKDNIFIQAMKDASLVAAEGEGDLRGLNCRQFTDFSEGAFVETKNQLDLALQGRGFFVLETPEGLRYTRNGNFSLAVDGTIVNDQGYPLIGASGKIQVPQAQKISETSISISQRGEITLGNTTVGKLRIVDFEKLEDLRKTGETLYTTEADEKEVTLDGHQVLIRQGYLEESNVEGIQEMIHLVELTRSFETDQRTLQAQDSTLERAMDVGRI